MMNRRSFTTCGAAAFFTPLPNMSFSQTSKGSEAEMPGFQIAETSSDGLVLTHGGMASPGVPVDDNTLFQVASCSKTVTALAIFSLVRDGRLMIDQPVNRYLQRWQLPGPRGGRLQPQQN